MNWCKKMNRKNVGSRIIPVFGKTQEQRKWDQFCRQLRADVMHMIPEASGVYFMDENHTVLRVYFEFDDGRRFVDTDIVKMMTESERRKTPKNEVKNFILNFIKHKCNPTIEEYYARMKKETVNGREQRVVVFDHESGEKIADGEGIVEMEDGCNGRKF